MAIFCVDGRLLIGAAHSTVCGLLVYDYPPFTAQSFYVLQSLLFTHC